MFYDHHIQSMVYLVYKNFPCQIWVIIVCSYSHVMHVVICGLYTSQVTVFHSQTPKWGLGTRHDQLAPFNPFTFRRKKAGLTADGRLAVEQKCIMKCFWRSPATQATLFPSLERVAYLKWAVKLVNYTASMDEIHPILSARWFQTCLSSIQARLVC